MRTLNWLWRGFLFFVLFAFALNNRHEVDLHWFWGYHWQAPMVMVVLVVFAMVASQVCWPWCPAGGAIAKMPKSACCGYLTPLLQRPPLWPRPLMARARPPALAP